jgi:hypothetical protein
MRIKLIIMLAISLSPTIQTTASYAPLGHYPKNFQLKLNPKYTANKEVPKLKPTVNPILTYRLSAHFATSCNYVNSTLRFFASGNTKTDKAIRYVANDFDKLRGYFAKQNNRILNHEMRTRNYYAGLIVIAIALGATVYEAIYWTLYLVNGDQNNSHD